MNYKIRISFLAICTLMVALSFAQKTNTKTNAPFKPPVVKSLLGIRSGMDTVYAAEAVQLIGLPLVVKDSKGNMYPIENYRLLYKRKGYIEDPETGKPEVNYTAVASRFDNTPLPKVWSENIQHSLQPGETLFFFEILVKDKAGRQFYAPELRIMIK